MTIKAERVVVSFFLAMVCLTMITGCDYPGSVICPVDLSSLSTDVSLFMQQLTQEAIAAYLF
jgi:hypothetical protein